jgi:hypothetical protein
MSTSIIWKHFKSCSVENEHKAECLLCDKVTLGKAIYIVRGKTPRSYSTKPLWNHLQKKHPSTYKTLQSKDKETADDADELNSDDPEAGASTSKPNPATGSQSQQSQPTIMESLERSKKWTLDDKRSKAVTRVICE